MNDFTKGVHKEVIYYHELVSHPSHHIEVGGEIVCDLIENKHDAKLYATAGRTATELAEAGYDAVKVLENLTSIMDSFEGGQYGVDGEIFARAMKAKTDGVA